MDSARKGSRWEQATEEENVFIFISRKGVVRFYAKTPDVEFSVSGGDVLFGPYTNEVAFKIWLNIREKPEIVFRDPPKQALAPVRFVDGFYPSCLSNQVLDNYCVGCGEPMPLGFGFCSECSRPQRFVHRRPGLVENDDDPTLSLAVRRLEDRGSH